MNINFNFCDINNFGDALNKTIFKELLNIEIISKSLKKSYIIGIGSVLDNLLKDSVDKKSYKNKISVFSSGFGFEEGGFFHNPNIILPEKLKVPVKIYALRGKLSKQRMQNLTGENLENIVLGDGGLLCNLLIDKEKITKKYKLGIVAHYADCENEVFDKILKSIENSVLLDVTKPPLDFLADLCECECIISTAMHPLIACDALQIPNLWGRVSEKSTSLYKYADYYSVFDLIKKPYNLNQKTDFSNLINDIYDNYNIPFEKVAKIQQDLFNILLLLKKDIKIEKLKRQLIFWRK